MNLYQKINEVKKVVKVLSKDAETSGKGKYSYVSGSQILGLIKDKMEELQLLFLPVETLHRGWTTFDYKNSYGDNKTDFIVDGEIVYEWINAENPEERQRVKFEYYGQQNDISKAFGSGLTYSERYILLKSLGAPTDDEDPDARTEDKPRAKEQKPANKAINGEKDLPFKDVKTESKSTVGNKREATIKGVLEYDDEKFKRFMTSVKKQWGDFTFGELTDDEFSDLMIAAGKFR